ncbi:hypothetical protein OSH10_15980 [Kaistia defluvii]|uniref:hypothetical protein n=1 Tax=Kaistia defluvii TaxID=410841 RepID=UPI002258BADB|nr:hypothetical protein [Kaistia defluvii]MCX5519941.1 hypothetical protein [Kaistia defluvii]
MRNFIIVAASVAFLASGAAAIAAEQADGTVSSVNASTSTLSLRTGQTFLSQDGRQLLRILPVQRLGIMTNETDGVGTYNPTPVRDENGNV